MFNNDETVAIVFNGEIYNFKELRTELENEGFHFNTTSDTEVIIRMYEKHGTGCFKYLNGMFALAIHDLKKNIVVIARDRFGKKPLYYFHTETMFAWASELKSLVKVLPFNKEISQTALNLFLNLTYIPASHTIYKNIFKLKAGHYLTINITDLTISSSQYWDISFDTTNKIENYDHAKKELQKLLFDSVEKRMIADVPLGVFLSGGVDSAMVAAIMAKISGEKIKTFSIGFQNKKYDESARAKQVAYHIGSHHHEYILDYDAIMKDIDAIILNYDEPFADSSCLPTYFVSKMTSEHVKVALTGDGGDEVFGGYNKSSFMLMAKNIKRWCLQLYIKR